MSYFYVWKWTQWKRWLVVVLLAFFTAGLLWFSQNKTASVSTSAFETSVLAKGNKDESDIALTFNISWGEEKVHDILKQLKEHNATATFFISGEWAEKHPDIVEKISEDEHEIGMLGYRYKSYLDQNIEEVQKDLFEAQDVFQKLGHEDINLLRTPSGHFNEDIIDLTDQLGFQVVHWNINPNDWENPGTQNIIDLVMQQTENGDILLLHASDAVKQTAGALDIILPALTNKGFEFITITEMMHQAKSKSELIE